MANSPKAKIEFGKKKENDSIIFQYTHLILFV